jgi:hypothetical protein
LNGPSSNDPRRRRSRRTPYTRRTQKPTTGGVDHASQTDSKNRDLFDVR